MRSFEQLLADLYFQIVFVRTGGEGKRYLSIKDGDKLPTEIQDAVRFHREKLIVYYGRPEMLQAELEAAKAQIDNLEAFGGDTSEAWAQYYAVLERRYAAYERPWAKVRDDANRCPTCPNLGKPVDIHGFLCATPCRTQPRAK